MLAKFVSLLSTMALVQTLRTAITRVAAPMPRLAGASVSKHSAFTQHLYRTLLHRAALRYDAPQEMTLVGALEWSHVKQLLLRLSLSLCLQPPPLLG
jgi:hypothetical protein